MSAPAAASSSSSSHAEATAALRQSVVDLFNTSFDFHSHSKKASPHPLHISSSPGRVNLIGEHTDYNDGFVMPMAIDKETYVVGRQNGLDVFRLVSFNTTASPSTVVAASADGSSSVVSSSSGNSVPNTDGTSTTTTGASTTTESEEAESRKRKASSTLSPTLASAASSSPIPALSSSSSSSDSILTFTREAFLSIPTTSSWHNYFRGVVAQYVKAGVEIPFFDAAIGGNVPLGGGLSSSASLEVATATWLDGLTKGETDKVEKALRCQKAEHEYANVPCGIMDQYVSSCGEESSAMLLDCRSRTFKSVPFTDPNVAILITNSNVKHDLGTSAYAERKASCEKAVKILQSKFGAEKIKMLRDATLEDLDAVEKEEEMDEVTFQRARHVITENQRTVQAASELSSNQYDAFGKLMIQSHVSMKNDYEISCDEIDELVEIAMELKGVYGTRMTGGGFGGCTVTLVEQKEVEQVKKVVAEKYRAKYNLDATFIVTRPCAGAKLWQ